MARYYILSQILLEACYQQRDENIKDVIQLLNKIKIQKIQVLAYNLKANGMIKKSYGPIKNALSKIEGKWIINLLMVLFAN